MIRAMWRLQRLGRVEAGIFTWAHFGILAERAAREAHIYEYDPYRELQRAQQTLTDPEQYGRAMERAEQMTALREERTATLGLAFIRGSRGVDAFAKLSRYEATIERSYYRALHELERLQRARLGEYVPPPLALDVTVNGRVDNATPPVGPDAGTKEDALSETTGQVGEN